MIKLLFAFTLCLSAVSTANAGGNASNCIAVGVENDHQIITNNCNQAIGVNYCHLPSTEPSTKSTECGVNGRYYQQFTTLEPGKSTGNKFSTPKDATIHWGACYGGEGKIHQTSNGQFQCRK